jgi:4-carboxymuconolactone decarboxylase
MPAKMPTKPRAARLPDLDEQNLSPAQRAMRDAVVTSRGLSSSKLGGPFAVWLHAPEFGDIVQKLGAHCRYRTALPPRLSEFSILTMARLWRAQFEWLAHAPIAQKAGVKPDTIGDLKAGRKPRTMAKDEGAIYDFVAELHRTRRVSDKTYTRVHAVLGDAGMVEFVGLLGYYTLVSMTLNVFRVIPPATEALPFKEAVTKR